LLKNVPVVSSVIPLLIDIAIEASPNLQLHTIGILSVGDVQALIPKNFG